MVAVIQVEQLGKRYRVRHEDKVPYRTLREDLTAVLRAPFSLLRGHRGSTEDFWALRDVSFEVQEGEVLGIIGRNGAGKSTLLKILSRITRPTTGRAVLRGRVASLLEVGTGFHPELTGRENIFLSGSILGMSREEIRRQFDAIVDFAEIEKFLDTPVKRYSSGMYVRLGFAIAAHLQPEILIIDEVLAVGDAQFQKKCLGKMGDVAKSGRTVLFVSHNMRAVVALCERALLLTLGESPCSGPTHEMVGQYQSAGSVSGFLAEWPNYGSAPGNSAIRMRRVSIDTEDSTVPLNRINMATPIRIEVALVLLAPIERFHVTLQFRTGDGVLAFVTSTGESPIHLSDKSGPRPRVVCHVPGNLLNEGTYYVAVLIVVDANVVCRADDVVNVTIRDDSLRRGSWYGKRQGAVRPLLEWSVENQIASTLDDRELQI